MVGAELIFSQVEIQRAATSRRGLGAGNSIEQLWPEGPFLEYDPFIQGAKAFAPNFDFMK
jgi:hypothetical protein